MDLAKLAFGILIAIFAIALLFGTAYYGGQAVGKAIAPQEPYTIAENAQGMHFYSKLHGGYSFDYPKTWGTLLDMMPPTDASTQEGMEIDELKRIMTVASNNEMVSIQVLAKKDADSSEMVMMQFSPQEEGIAREECDSGIIRESADLQATLYGMLGAGGTDKAAVYQGMRNATASWQKIGQLEGCVIETVAKGTGEGAEKITMMQGECGANVPVSIAQMGNTTGFTADAMKIISSLRCGKDAVPN